MRDFDYERGADEATAVRRGKAPEARFIAGGTLLVDLLRLDVERPDRLVDLNGLALNKVEQLPDGLLLGALLTNTELAYHPLVSANFPALSQAVLSGASPQMPRCR